MVNLEAASTNNHRSREHEKCEGLKGTSCPTLSFHRRGGSRGGNLSKANQLIKGEIEAII